MRTQHHFIVGRWVSVGGWHVKIGWWVPEILPKCPAFSCPKLPPPSNYPTDFDQTKGTAGGNHILQTNTRGPDAHSHLPHRPAPQEPFQVENREKVIFRPPRSTGLAPHNHHLNNHAKWSCGHDRRLTCSPTPLLWPLPMYYREIPHQNKKANHKIPHRVPQKSPLTATT